MVGKKNLDSFETESVENPSFVLDIIYSSELNNYNSFLVKTIQSVINYRFKIELYHPSLKNIIIILTIPSKGFGSTQEDSINFSKNQKILLINSKFKGYKKFHSTSNVKEAMKLVFDHIINTIDMLDIFQELKKDDLKEYISLCKDDVIGKFEI